MFLDLFNNMIYNFRFKGIREGGVSENAAFYVFTHGPDGVIDAYPLKEW